jgi:hypothetical protein
MIDPALATGVRIDLPLPEDSQLRLLPLHDL